MPPYNYLAKTQRLIFFEFDATRHTIIVRFRNTCCCRLHLHHFIQPLKINIDLTPQIYTLTPNPTRLKRIIIRYQFSHTKCIFTIKIGTIEIIDERTPRLVIHNWLNDWMVYYYIFFKCLLSNYNDLIFNPFESIMDFDKVKRFRTLFRMLYFFNYLWFDGNDGQEFLLYGVENIFYYFWIDGNEGQEFFLYGVVNINNCLSFLKHTYTINIHIKKKQFYKSFS